MIRDLQVRTAGEVGSAAKLKAQTQRLPGIVRKSRKIQRNPGRLGGKVVELEPVPEGVWHTVMVHPGRRDPETILFQVKSRVQIRQGRCGVRARVLSVNGLMHRRRAVVVQHQPVDIGRRVAVELARRSLQRLADETEMVAGTKFGVAAVVDPQRHRSTEVLEPQPRACRGRTQTGVLQLSVADPVDPILVDVDPEALRCRIGSGVRNCARHADQGRDQICDKNKQKRRQK